MNILIKTVLDTGESAQFMPRDFEPLNYEDFAAEGDKDNKTYGFKCRVEYIEIEREGSKVKNHDKGEVKFSVNFNTFLRIFALVEGGVLPPVFLSHPNLMVDSNVIGHLQAIQKGTVELSVEETEWWHSLLKNQKSVV